MVRSPMQRSIRSRESTQGSKMHLVSDTPGLNLRPEALIASCDRGFATSLQRVDSGPTTRRATVHSLRSGLKIESPKTREGPRVIIFRPWLEKHGSSDATAMVQLKKDARNIAGSAACYHFWSRNRIHFPASCEEPFRSEFDHAPCIYFYFVFFSPRASCVIEIS